MSTQTQSGHSAGGMLMMLAVLTLLILVVVWYANLPGGHTLGQRLDAFISSTPPAVSRTTDRLTSHETAAKASQAATKIDAALKKTGDAASTAAAEIGNDIKAAVNEQKKQNAARKPDKAVSSASGNGANDQ